MRRREVITLLGGAIAAWPRVAQAQQQAVVGVLRSSSFTGAPQLVTAFKQGLNERGFVEDQNVTLLLRSAEDRVEQLPALISDLVHRQASVLVGDTASALAAIATSTTTPFVFASGTDPVRDGLVQSLNRPAGNMTGVIFFNRLVGTKRLEMLRQLLPAPAPIGVLVDLSMRAAEVERTEVEAAALAVGQQLLVQGVRDEAEIEAAISGFAHRGARALFVGAGGLLNSHGKAVLSLAARHALPAAYAQRENVINGGLMSYGASMPDAYRQVGLYAARILQGEKPSQLPVIQAVKFEFVLNLKTARSLGLDVPDRLLALADEVID
ncbi:MAG: ABC transporter substrate-binding protein [Candidatus Sulfotelmatobacter sp.]